MASKRQVFKRGQKVFICTSRGSKSSLAIWSRAVVVQYPAKECQKARGFGYHHCNPKATDPISACRVETDLARVKICQLNRDGKEESGVWAQKTINNTRSKVLTLEEGEPIMEELAQRRVQRDQAFKMRSARSTVQHRMEKAAVPMAKALKKIQVRFRDDKTPILGYAHVNELRQIATDVLELLKAPKKTED